MDPDTRATYDRIAGHFSSTREHPWPEVETFVSAVTDDGAAPVGTALDDGCGNGRHAELLAAVADRVVGLDASRGVLREARDRATARGFTLSLVQGDAGALPFGADRFDVVVYVATLHHLPTRRARVSSLDEVARVLAPDGWGLVSTWSTEHDRFDEEDGFDTSVAWTLPDGETVPRYYHIYDPEEFATDLEASDLSVDESFVSSGNCYARVRPS
jgi:ubiquinone/menaquinone biosynthesis C-methylase UbiE